MYALSLYGMLGVYSTQKLAQVNACKFLMKHQINNPSNFLIADHKEELLDFKESFQREDYVTCIGIWNKMALMCYYGNILYQVLISPMEIDKAFI